MGLAAFQVASFSDLRVDERQLGALCRGQHAGALLSIQLVAAFHHVAIRIVAGQIDQQGRRPRVRTQQQVPDKGAITKFGSGQLPVNCRRGERGQIRVQLFKRNRRILQQGDIQDGYNRLDALQGRQIVPQADHGAQRLIREQITLRRVGQHEKVALPVAGADQTRVLQVLVVLQDQRVRRGIQPEASGLESEQGCRRHDAQNGHGGMLQDHSVKEESCQ